MILLALALAAAPQSRVAEVVVYPDRAQVTRALELPCAPGAVAVFEGLPPTADQGSFRARAKGGEILGLRVEDVPQLAAFQPQVEVLDKAIRDLQQQDAALADAVEAQTRLYDAAAVRDHAASLRRQAADAGRVDAGRLRDLAAGLEAQLDGLALRPQGQFDAEPPALQHLVDIVANDLQLQVVLGQWDAGLANLARRLLLAEALACHLADDAGRRVVSAADTTRALHVVYRSEPELTGLAAWQVLPRR